MLAEALSSLLPSGIFGMSLENPALSLNDPRTWDELLGGVETESGIKITHRSALELAPVWQSVAMLSGDVAGLPLPVYRRELNGDRKIDRDHPAQFIMNEQPNAETSAFEFWRRLMVHALLWQNAYAFIAREGRVGRPRELINLLPDRTRPGYDDNGKLFYVTETAGELIPLLKEEVLHVKGVSLENSKGSDLVDKARNSWGLALAAEHFNSKFFAHGAQAGGILEIPFGMKKKAMVEVEEGWARNYTTKDNWFKTAILREGVKFHSITIDAEKSQLHELREDQVRDVARFFNLPPFKLGLSDSVSYNSQEQSQLVYLSSAVNHWLNAIKGEVTIKLLTERERRQRTHFVEHNVSKLIETDIKTQNEVLEIQRRNLVINADQWRRKINLNKREDGGGGEYVNPNTKSAGGVPEAAKAEKAINAANRQLFADAVGRVARRVGQDARRASKSSAKFCKWLETGVQSHRSWLEGVMRPVVDVLVLYVGGQAEGVRDLIAERFFGTIGSALDSFTRPPHAADRLAANVDEWCTVFERDIAAEIAPLVFPGDDE